MTGQVAIRPTTSGVTAAPSEMPRTTKVTRARALRNIHRTFGQGGHGGEQDRTREPSGRQPRKTQGRAAGDRKDKRFREAARENQSGGTRHNLDFLGSFALAYLSPIYNRLFMRGNNSPRSLPPRWAAFKVAALFAGMPYGP